MKTHIIQLERHDDAVSTRDKMMWGSSQRILLVFPERGNILERRVDLVLLQRHSQALGSQLALVSNRYTVRQHARDLGIPVFKSVIQAQKSPWRIPFVIRRKFMRRAPVRTPLDNLRSIRAKPARQLTLGERLLIFTLGVAAVLALMIFIFPGAFIQLSMLEQEQQLSIELRASPAITSPNLSGGIPAYLTSVVVEGSETGRSTGRTRIANRAAGGEVVFASLSDQDVLVPVGTIVRTLDDPPVRFETMLSVVVKAGNQDGVIAPIRAIVAGSGGNVPSGTIIGIEGPVGPLVSVINEDFTSGGSDQLSPAPSSGDFDRARQQILTQLAEQAQIEMKAGLPSDSYLLSSTIQLEAVEYEKLQPAEGEPGDQYTITVRAWFAGWYVTASDIYTAAEIGLNAALPAGYMPVPDTLRIKLNNQSTTEANKAGYQVETMRKLKANWTKEEVVHLVRGKDLMTAAAIIESRFAMESPPQFQMTPGWWPRLPYLPLRIQVGAQ
jgi:hypothetical protein